jgi:hypothetical protein
MRVLRLFIALVAGALPMLMVVSPGIAQQRGIEFGPPEIHPKAQPHRSGPVSDQPQPVPKVVGAPRQGTPSAGAPDSGTTDPVMQRSETETRRTLCPND